MFYKKITFYSNQILKKVFYLEIPEISNGLIEIKAIAREAGSRSKVAIYTEAENVDPVAVESAVPDLGVDGCRRCAWAQHEVVDTVPIRPIARERAELQRWLHPCDA